ncbi:MAG: hypothetical protein JWR75_1909 [Devosia sp.]|nr:hypothetical protein [Devosia sp.]
MTLTSARKQLSRVVMAGMLVVSAMISVPAFAQEVAPDHLALARKYVDLTDQSAIYEVTLVQTGIETMRTLIGQNPEMLDEIDTAVGKVLEQYKGKKGELLDQFARVYALNFSPEELQQIVAFYESPVGIKLATSNAEVNQDLQRVMGVFENNTKTEFFAKVRAELKAQGIEL